MKDELNLSHCDTFNHLKLKIDEYYSDERFHWDLVKMTPSNNINT